MDEITKIVEILKGYDWHVIIAFCAVGYAFSRNIKKQMEKQFDYMEKRFDKIDERFEKIDQRFEKIDDKLNDIDRRLCRLEGAFSSKDCCYLKEDRQLKKVENV